MIDDNGGGGSQEIEGQQRIVRIANIKMNKYRQNKRKRREKKERDRQRAMKMDAERLAGQKSRVASAKAKKSRDVNSSQRDII